MKIKAKDLRPLECIVVKITDSINYEYFHFETIEEAKEFIRNDSGSSEYNKIISLDNNITYGLLLGTDKICEWNIVTAEEMGIKLYTVSV